jgi:hypothetical protein
MDSRRRLVALATTAAIVWTALWPLVSSAPFLAVGDAVPLCHQAGMQVSPDQAPMDESQPGAPPKSKQHCPLCIMVFLAAVTPPVVAPTPPLLEGDTAPQPYWAPPRSGVETQLPQGRAPPVTA